MTSNKTIHKYNDELESILIKMSDDEFQDWLLTNEITYDKTLLDVILEDKLSEVQDE